MTNHPDHLDIILPLLTIISIQGFIRKAGATPNSVVGPSPPKIPTPPCSAPSGHQSQGVQGPFTEAAIAGQLSQQQLLRVYTSLLGEYCKQLLSLNNKV